MINLDELQDKILSEQCTDKLYRIQIDLSRMIRNAKVQKELAETIMEQSEAGGNLGVYYSMLEVVHGRIEKLKQEAKDDRDYNGRLNHNFRLAAKNVLKKDTYAKIMELAMINRPEIKRIKSELIKNKIE
jgi:hypothetical protein